MITSVFRKSSPFNYTIVVFLTLAFFLLVQFNQGIWHNSSLTIGTSIGILILVFASLFITNFIVKKNGLTKNSSFSILFFTLFLLPLGAISFFLIAIAVVVAILSILLHQVLLIEMVLPPSLEELLLVLIDLVKIFLAKLSGMAVNGLEHVV